VNIETVLSQEENIGVQFEKGFFRERANHRK
jgi:hypothetical protein